MGVGPREKEELIRPTKASRGGTYFVPSRLRLRELRPEKAAVCQARLFPCGEQTEQADPQLHPSTLQHSLNLAISQCPRINLRYNHGNLSRPRSIILHEY